MKKIGIIGAGQLGRMLGLAGIPLGKRFTFVDPSEDAGARQVGSLMLAEYHDADAIAELARQSDVISYEFENVSVETIEGIEQHTPVYPPSGALRITQDRLSEKTFFNDLGVTTAPFLAIHSLSDLQQAVDLIGLPGILKTRREGYDGKGQALLREKSDVLSAWNKLGGQPLIYEGFVAFDHECSLIGARGQNGQTVFYPLTRNLHHQGILALSQPVPDHPLQALAQAVMQQVLEGMNYVGVLTIEFFVAGDRLIANEMAPRVHNSGHWSIDAAATSQFENHIRAITGLPLGSTEIRSPCAMINILGHMPNAASLLSLPQVRYHSYDKADRPGRKVGHINVLASSWQDLDEQVRQVSEALGMGHIVAGQATL